MTHILKTPSPVTPDYLAKALTYTQYRELADQLMAENKTTGNNHSEEMVAYTRMNLHRMRRVEKTTRLDDELVQLLLSVQTKMVWLVLTEAWCGDAAQNLPVLVKMADASPLIDLKLLLRDENPELMDQYLTNGGRSIPKLIALKADTLEELGTWGPRPEPAQRLYADLHAQNIPYKEFAEQLHGWYGKDRGKALQQEFKSLLPQWSELTAPEDQPLERRY
ncbi:thioredoxin family protein [Pontibacter liquoris]|uniref:thioredoxin family protein n=1 Tax=Pontibacter liquoris TaxID=2905677 RepID=UPI001FA74C38|nr:thioredoxin family protein [Pontibacter liquoris]